MNKDNFYKYLKYKTKYLTYKYSGGSENTEPLSTMPKLCFGTVQGTTLDVKNNIKLALKNGYRHIDSAECYAATVSQHGDLSYLTAVKEGIHEGLVENNLTRTDIWVTFKGDSLTTEKIFILIETLELDYFDLFLIHHTCGTTTDYDVLKILLDIKVVQYWGVSNCDNLEHLSEIKDIIPGHPLYVNQIQAVPSGIDIIGRDMDLSIDLVNEINELGIKVMLFSPTSGYMNDYNIDKVVDWLNDAELIIKYYLLKYIVNKENVLVVGSVTGRSIPLNIELYHEITLDSDYTLDIKALDDGDYFKKYLFIRR